MLDDDAWSRAAWSNEAKRTPTTTKPATDTDAGTIERGRRDKPVRVGGYSAWCRTQNLGKGDTSKTGGVHKHCGCGQMKALVDLTCHLAPVVQHTQTGL